MQATRKRKTPPTKTFKTSAKRQKLGSLANPPSSRRLTVEKKNVDVALVGATLFPIATSIAVVTALNLMGQGAAAGQHLGRTAQMKSIQYRLSTNMAATTTGSGSLRVVIVYDKQSNGAAPTAVQVFQANHIASPMNLSNSKRFIVLVDDTHEGLSVTGPASAYMKNFKKINLPIEYFDTNNGDITDIATGSVYMFTFNDSGFGVAAPNNIFYSRMRFQDV